MFNPKPHLQVQDNTKYIVVADLFQEDYVGGGELTLQAILDSCTESYYKIHSQHLTTDFIQQHKNKYWILGNISQVTKDSIIEIATTTQYSCIAFDFFYCKYRSQQLHKIKENKGCDCHITDYGRFVLGLYKRSQHTFFMSEGQLNIHKQAFPSMNSWPNNKLIVQGSTFNKQTLNVLEQLGKKYSEKNGKWFIQGGGNTSWIKNTQGCVEHCIKNNLSYDVVSGLPPEQFLDKMAQYEGLIFLPAGYDTSPRITIEAKALGLKLVLNDFVLQKDDPWFNQEPKDLLSHLESLPQKFWKVVKE